MLFRVEHLTKLYSSSFMVEGKDKSTREMQSLKQKLLIMQMFSMPLILCSKEQPEKQAEGRTPTDFGIFTVVKAVHPLKQPPPITLNLFGNVKFGRLMQ